MRSRLTRGGPGDANPAARRRLRERGLAASSPSRSRNATTYVCSAQRQHMCSPSNRQSVTVGAAVDLKTRRANFGARASCAQQSHRVDKPSSAGSSVPRVNAESRVAVVAIVVSGLVSVATLIATTNHDSSRLHAEQVQADRTELRKVLDNASGTLSVAAARFRRLNISSYPRPRSYLFGRQLKQVEEQIDRISRRSDRVAIRLGRAAPAAKQLAKARDAANHVRDLYIHVVAARTEKGVESAADALLTAALGYEDQVDRFVNEAHRIARSTT